MSIVAFHPSNLSRANWREAAFQLLVPPVLFYLGVKLSLLFALTEDTIVMLWMPNGILLATLLRFGFKRYGLVALAILIAEVAADYPTFSLAESLAFGVINVLEATGAYVLLRRTGFDPAFPQPVDLAKFAFAGPLVAALAAAFAAGGVYVFFGGHVTTYWNFVRVWWFSDGLGLLIITPLVLSLWSLESRVQKASYGFRWYDAVVLGIGVCLAGVFALSDDSMFRGIIIRAFVLLPFALYVAARFELPVVTAAIAAISILVLYVAHAGQDPFGPLPIQETVIAVQEFILTMSVMSLGLHAVLAQQASHRAQLEDRVRARTTELEEANFKLEKLALTDPLTGLPNRRALYAQLAAELNRHHRHHRSMALIIFDIDHFKRVNDRYGHSAGDTVLQHVANVASKVIREMDTLVRYGGEEFVLIAPEIDPHNAIELAERIHAAIRAHGMPFDHEVLRVTASFGVAMMQQEDVQPESLLRRADAALYAAKEGGRDRVNAADDREGTSLLS